MTTEKASMEDLLWDETLKSELVVLTCGTCGLIINNHPITWCANCGTVLTRKNTTWKDFFSQKKAFLEKAGNWHPKYDSITGQLLD